MYSDKRTSLNNLIKGISDSIFELSKSLESFESLKILLEKLGFYLPYTVSNLNFDVDISSLITTINEINDLENSDSEEDQILILSKYLELLDEIITIIDNIKDLADELNNSTFIPSDYIQKTSINTELPTRLLNYLIVNNIWKFRSNRPLYSALFRPLIFNSHF